MDLGLESKVAIVTGGSKGIGMATAMCLAQEGVDVAICARGAEALEEAATEIRSKTGRRVLTLRADVTVPEDIENMVAATVAEFGGVDILVNNAVYSIQAPFMELTDEQWYMYINSKLMGYVRCSRAVIPHMQRRGGGSIMMMGSTAGRNVSARGMSNGVVNSGVSNLAKNLANQFGKDGILVNCIHPGGTRTPRLTQMQEKEARDTSRSMDEIMSHDVSRVPIGRLAEPEEFGYLVLFLASDRAKALTGQTIAIDGGSTLGMYY